MDLVGHRSARRALSGEATRQSMRGKTAASAARLARMASGSAWSLVRVKARARVRVRLGS